MEDPWREMYTIAVIDDDIFIGDMLEKALSKEGYRVIRAYSGTEALLLLERRRPDLILLDLMLPGLSGEQVIEKISDIPVIVVSARTSVDDKVTLLTGGAVDYVTKPFDIRELMARISAQIRAAENQREKSREAKMLIFEEIRMDLETREVSVEGKPVYLTPTEFAVLKQLMRNPEQVATKSRILDAISMDTPDCTEGSLKIHISNIRKKLKKQDGQDHIEAVWGIGFKMKR